MRLTILLLTYASSVKSPRAKYAETTLRSTLDNLKFSGEVAVHIADDGSPPAHTKKLREIAGGYAHVVSVGQSNSERRGYGASYNLATQAVHPGTDIVLPLEDDWELVRPLDIDSYVAGLNTGIIGCVRLGYAGFTQALTAQFLNLGDSTYLYLDGASEERHVWAGHPRLETVDFQRDLGPWPEGIDPGSTEFEVAGRPAAREGVVWPLYYDRAYAHIGAVQARDDQGGSK